MIIVKLMGGLGNQMFQYAAGRRLAHVHGTELRLDHSFLETARDIATPRRYELCHLNVSCSRASRDDCSAVAMHGLIGPRRWIMANRPLSLQLSLSGCTIQERSFCFDPAFFTLPDNVYIEGYWQSERYFSDITGIIREEFSFQEPLSGENLRIADAINSCCAVSLHIRRGDYVSSKQTAAVHGVCSLNYYSRAVKKLAEQEPDPHFFVFSDDITWVMEHLRIDYPVTFVGHNTADRGYDDMRLMSQCRHHIIANSSFSWWGAWLNPRPDKVVIAPSRWFSDPAIDTSSLIPASWHRITP